MNKAQCLAAAKAYREAASFIQKEGIERWPGDFAQLFIWQSEVRILRAHAHAHEAAATEAT